MGQDANWRQWRRDAWKKYLVQVIDLWKVAAITYEWPLVQASDGKAAMEKTAFSKSVSFFSLRVYCSSRLLVTELSIKCTCEFLVYNTLKTSHLSAENFNH